MRIRPESEADRAAIRAVNTAAFETSVEADIVEALHAKGVRLVSLVAELDGATVGHILFSPVSLAEHPQLRVVALGPMAVVPHHQRNGIGSALVREGLKRCRQLGYQAAIVIGHPEYYPRFGFVPAGKFGIRCEYDVPENVFMIVELEAGALRGVSGLIRYDEAFGRT
jgi:putative acetyltransferase